MLAPEDRDYFERIEALVYEALDFEDQVDLYEYVASQLGVIDPQLEAAVKAAIMSIILFDTEQTSRYYH